MLSSDRQQHATHAVPRVSPMPGPGQSLPPPCWCHLAATKVCGALPTSQGWLALESQGWFRPCGGRAARVWWWVGELPPVGMAGQPPPPLALRVFVQGPQTPIAQRLAQALQHAPKAVGVLWGSGLARLTPFGTPRPLAPGPGATPPCTPAQPQPLQVQDRHNLASRRPIGAGQALAGPPPTPPCLPSHQARPPPPPPPPPCKNPEKIGVFPLQGAHIF